jgi:hypothetical protein
MQGMLGLASRCVCIGGPGWLPVLFSAHVKGYGLGWERGVGAAQDGDEGSGTCQLRVPI